MKESLHISVHDEPSTSHESLLDRAYWEWKTSFEFFAPKIVAGIGFATGFFVGGVKHQNSARERFEVYAAGKFMGNHRNYMRRQNDFVILMFVKNGIKPGCVMASMFFTMVASVTYLSAYYNYYSPLYFPIASAITCGIFATPVVGLHGLAFGMGMGLTTGTAISLTIAAAAFLEGKSVDEFYSYTKNHFEEWIKLNEQDGKVELEQQTHSSPLDVFDDGPASKTT